MVGGTGIEPVTPTMSRQRALANCLIYNEIVTSKFANCSRYIHGNTGQNRAKTGRGLWFWIVAALAMGIQPCHAADATRLVTAEARRQGVPVAFALRVARATVAARTTLLAGITTERDLGTEGAGYADVGLRDAVAGIGGERCGDVS